MHKTRVLYHSIDEVSTHSYQVSNTNSLAFFHPYCHLSPSSNQELLSLL